MHEGGRLGRGPSAVNRTRIIRRRAFSSMIYGIRSSCTAVHSESESPTRARARSRAQTTRARPGDPPAAPTQTPRGPRRLPASPVDGGCGRKFYETGRLDGRGEGEAAKARSVIRGGFIRFLRTNGEWSSGRWEGWRKGGGGRTGRRGSRAELAIPGGPCGAEVVALDKGVEEGFDEGGLREVPQSAVSFESF